MLEKQLQHVGVLGMKWGRRKGTTVDPGTHSSDHKIKTALLTKDTSQLSNEEIRTLTQRLQLEKQYKDITKKERSAGEKFVAEVLVTSGKQQAMLFTGTLMGMGAAYLLKRITGK